MSPHVFSLCTNALLIMLWSQSSVSIHLFQFDFTKDKKKTKYNMSVGVNMPEGRWDVSRGDWSVSMGGKVIKRADILENWRFEVEWKKTVQLATYYYFSHEWMSIFSEEIPVCIFSFFRYLILYNANPKDTFLHGSYHYHIWNQTNLHWMLYTNVSVFDINVFYENTGQLVSSIWKKMRTMILNLELTKPAKEVLSMVTIYR